MNAATALHYFFLSTAAIATVSLLFARHVFYAALLLIITLLSLAGLYVLTLAEFLAVTQILVYAGGILVVMIFAIMLTSQLNGKPLLIDHSNRVPGAIIGMAFFGILTYLMADQFPLDASAQPGDFTVSKIGTLLMSAYALPFEVTGLVLLLSLVGAAVIASSSSPKHQ
jgi:NADH:ubiquinone oxidoreductase subunit 6 (subunit J)